MVFFFSSVDWPNGLRENLNFETNPNRIWMTHTRWILLTRCLWFRYKKNWWSVNPLISANAIYTLFSTKHDFQHPVHWSILFYSLMPSHGIPSQLCRWVFFFSYFFFFKMFAQILTNHEIIFHFLLAICIWKQFVLLTLFSSISFNGLTVTLYFCRCRSISPQFLLFNGCVCLNWLFDLSLWFLSMYRKMILHLKFVGSK